jgi:hypothetical protein
MNRATKIIELPALTVDLLKANGVIIDNVFASLWRNIGMKTVLNRAGFNKRSGTSMSNVIFGLIFIRYFIVFNADIVFLNLKNGADNSKIFKVFLQCNFKNHFFYYTFY